MNLLVNKRGWVLKFGKFFIRWNKQDGYSEFTIGLLKSFTRMFD